MRKPTSKLLSRLDWYALWSFLIFFLAFMSICYSFNYKIQVYRTLQIASDALGQTGLFKNSELYYVTDLWQQNVYIPGSDQVTSLYNQYGTQDKPLHLCHLKHNEMEESTDNSTQ